MNVLVTAIGSFSADCVINTLKAHGHKVIGCDIYPSNWHAVSKDCNKVYQAPFATKEDEYIKFLIDVIGKEGIDFLMPLTDLEIDVIDKYRECFLHLQKKVKLGIQTSETLEIARNKYILCKTFERDEYVQVPMFAKLDITIEDFPLPAIAKPFHGRSSEGLLKIEDSFHLNLVKSKKDYIIEKFIQGSIFTVDYVRDSFGNDFSVPREELLRTKNGAGTTIRIEPNEILMRTVSYIGDRIGIVGCVNMEFIKNENNQYFLIDINPRFSAGIAFSNFIGYDMIISHVNCFENKPILPRIDFTEQIIYKRYKEESLG